VAHRKGQCRASPGLLKCHGGPRTQGCSVRPHRLLRGLFRAQFLSLSRARSARSSDLLLGKGRPVDGPSHGSQVVRRRRPAEELRLYREEGHEGPVAGQREGSWVRQLAAGVAGECSSSQAETRIVCPSGIAPVRRSRAAADLPHRERCSRWVTRVVLRGLRAAARARPGAVLRVHEPANPCPCARMTRAFFRVGIADRAAGERAHVLVQALRCGLRPSARLSRIDGGWEALHVPLANGRAAPQTPSKARLLGRRDPPSSHAIVGSARMRTDLSLRHIPIGSTFVMIQQAPRIQKAVPQLTAAFSPPGRAAVPAAKRGLANAAVKRLIETGRDWPNALWLLRHDGGSVRGQGMVRPGFRRTIRNSPLVARVVLFPTLAAASLVLACATVPAGYGAVVTSAVSGVQQEPLREGVSFVGLGAHVDVLDLRAQEEDEDLKGLAADGAPVRADASVVTWHIIPAELVAFDREVGPNPYARIIRPVVQAAVRQVVARYSAVGIMDTRNIPAIEKAVTELGARQIRPMHVQLDMVVMRGLVVASGPLNEEIIDTARLEQRALTMPHEIEIERARAEERRELGRADSAANVTIAPTLAPAQIADAEAKAWTSLLSSPWSSVAVTTEASPLLEVTP